MKYFYIITLLSILFSCGKTTERSDPESKVKSKLLQIMHIQEKAWSKGDINLFMQGYWQSDSLKFVGSHGINFGWKTTLKNYKESYPNTKTMGKLHFEIDYIEKLSSDTYYLIGRYTLIRENDKPSGYFNLIWRKINGKWKIVTDMTCG